MSSFDSTPLITTEVEEQNQQEEKAPNSSIVYHITTDYLHKSAISKSPSNNTTIPLIDFTYSQIGCKYILLTILQYL